MQLDPRRAERLAVVRAAHQFILAVVPYTHPHSVEALRMFAQRVAESPLPIPDLESVILQILVILQRHSGELHPTLVERYLADRAVEIDVLSRFRDIVETVIARHAVCNSYVRRSLNIIETCYADPRLTARTIAEAVGRRQQLLAESFYAEVGVYPSEYLRAWRLDCAAALLATSHQSIKEVWAAVGFNHASNFDHDFKKRFGVSPTNYRGGTPYVREASQRPVIVAVRPPTQSRESNSHTSVLIVDDDDGTRETVARYLRLEGFDVTVAATGSDAIARAVCLKPHVMLLDYHLPDMSGTECLVALRERDLSLPVVIFSADWDIDLTEVNALRATTLSKVCALEEIRDKVASVATTM